MNVRAVRLDPEFSAAMDRLSHAVATVSDGFAAQDDSIVQRGYEDFDAAVLDALDTMRPELERMRTRG